MRVKQLKGNESLAATIRNTVSGMGFIEKLRINTLTGSILVEYDAGQRDELKKFIEQAHQAGSIPEEIEVDQIYAILEGKSANGDQDANISANVRSVFGQLNDQVKYWTGNKASLNELIPISLLGLGVRSMMMAESITGPPWHTYVWYAFSSFLVLNPSGGDQKEGQG